MDRNTRPTLQHQQELMDPSSYSHSTTIIKDNPLFTSSSATRAAFSSSGSLSNKQNSSDSLLSSCESAVSVDQSENSIGIGNKKSEDQDNIKRLCDSMRRQILARAFYGCKLMQFPENYGVVGPCNPIIKFLLHTASGSFRKRLYWLYPKYGAFNLIINNNSNKTSPKFLFCNLKKQLELKFSVLRCFAIQKIWYHFHQIARLLNVRFSALVLFPNWLFAHATCWYNALSVSSRPVTNQLTAVILLSPSVTIDRTREFNFWEETLNGT